MNREEVTVVQPEAARLPDASSPQARQLWPVLLLIALGVLIYLNSFKGQFQLDDHDFLDDPSLHRLWPLWQVMFAPSHIARPVVSLSLALNHAISGKNVWSYHALNLMVHLLGALTLFGIIRRTLLTEKLRARFGHAATPLSLSVALLWMVHPLQTESVTYIVQRAESLMGLFYLLTLYCIIRGATVPRPLRWYLAAFAACLLGMGCKPVMVTAPIMVFLYDLTFLSGSIRESLRRRWSVYAGLATTWAFLALTVLASKSPQVSAGFALQSVSPLNYLKTQFGVILYYLRLSLWPEPLCLDYNWPVATAFWDYAPYGLIVVALVLASLYGLYRRAPLGFLRAWFFVILAPTSSIMPIADLAVEHRLYLSLAAVVTLVIIGGYSLVTWLIRRMATASTEATARLPWLGVGALAILVAWFGSTTVRRNSDYHSEQLMWTDVLKKRPENPRAHSNLGLLLAERGAYDEAAAHFEAAMRFNPGFVEAYNNMGMVLSDQGKGQEALPYFYHSLQLRPNAKRSHFNIGQVLASQDHWDEAIGHYQQELQIDPQFAEAYWQLGRALEIQKRYPEAVAYYGAALMRWPEWKEVMLRLTNLLIASDAPMIHDPREAATLAERVVQLTGRQHPAALDVLAAVYAAQGRFPEAVTTAKEAMERAAAIGADELRAAIQTRLQKYEQGQTAD